MRRAAVRATFALTVGAGVGRLLVACSDYAAEETPVGVDASNDGAPPSDAASDATSDAGSDARVCPARFMPAEGTYAYATLYSFDRITLGDAAPNEVKIDSPIFATVRHEANACFRFTTNFYEGAQGKHTHSWLFCNACDRSEGSLDLVEETDLFSMAAVGNVEQRTSFTCQRPNSYLVTDLPIDASIAQGFCTGTGQGGASNQIQVVPKDYRYEGPATVDYAQEDASVDVRIFYRTNQTIVSGGGSPSDDFSRFAFDQDSGMVRHMVVHAETTTKFGTVDVKYVFNLGGFAASSAVTPLVDP